MNTDHGAEETRLGLPVKLFLNARVAHEDERALLKVVIMDGRGEALDEFSSRLLPGLQDSGRHLMKVFRAFLQLLGMMRNEVLGWRRDVRRGKKICSLR